MLRLLFTVTAFIAGLMLGLVADDWTTGQMVRQGLYPAGYHCERVQEPTDGLRLTP